jgi:hypothetical protein
VVIFVEYTDFVFGKSGGIVELEQAEFFDSAISRGY